uniref:Odorant receptor n=1 Tax=Lutzomyia longipalpis TaxID=7200 RepID=A0A7G3B2U4_LUTLO
MLKTYNEKLSKLINKYFAIYEMQWIPTVNCAVIDRGKLFVFPLIFSFALFCTAWHLFFQMESLDNVLEVTFTSNLTIAYFQTIITILTINLYSKKDLVKVLNYFEDIATSKDEYLAAEREKYLGRNLQFAWKLVRIFLIGMSVESPVFPLASLLQSNFTRGLTYRIPGIPPNSIFFIPANTVGEILLFFLLVCVMIIGDTLLLIYFFYFRGEFLAITSLTDLLSRPPTSSNYHGNLLKKIYCSHQRALNEFSRLSNFLWHFYCQKLFGISLYLITSLFVFSKGNDSLLIGIFLLIFIICQLAMLCIPGQLIDNCSEAFRERLYMNFSCEMNIKDQRNLLILMMGARKNISAQTFGLGKVSIFTLVQVKKE